MKEREMHYYEEVVTLNALKDYPAMVREIAGIERAYVRAACASGGIEGNTVTGDYTPLQVRILEQQEKDPSLERLKILTEAIYAAVQRLPKQEKEVLMGMYLGARTLGARELARQTRYSERSIWRFRKRGLGRLAPVLAPILCVWRQRKR